MSALGWYSLVMVFLCMFFQSIAVVASNEIQHKITYFLSLVLNVPILIFLWNVVI